MDRERAEEIMDAVESSKPWHERIPARLGVEPTMTRSDLSSFIAEKCDGIKGLFDYKNQDYGADRDAFANFRKTAQRIIVPFMEKRGVSVSETEAMFLVLLIYQDKHLVALSQTGLQGNEVDERLGDIANYALIARGMLIQSKGV